MTGFSDALATGDIAQDVVLWRVHVHEVRVDEDGVMLSSGRVLEGPEAADLLRVLGVAERFAASPLAPHSPTREDVAEMVVSTVEEIRRRMIAAVKDADID